jgi:hypothetical protein
LQMLLPLLSSWLEDSQLDPTEFSLRARAAIAIIAMFSLDIQSSDPSATIFRFAPQLRQTLILTICRMINYLSCIEADDDYALWVSPIMALVQAEPKLLHGIFEHVRESIGSGTVNQFAQASTIQVLLNFVIDPRLATVLCGAADLVHAARAMEAKLGEGPPLQMGGRFRAMVELKAGML